MNNVIKYAQMTALSVILGTTALSVAVAQSGAASPGGAASPAGGMSSGGKGSTSGSINTGGQLNSNSMDSTDSTRPTTSNPTGSATLAQGNSTDGLSGSRDSGQRASNGASMSFDRGGASGNATSSDWAREDTYWRQNYSSRPYSNENQDYGTYQPAYRYGVNTANDPSNASRRFEDLDQRQLESGWNQSRGNSTLEWNQARDAIRDSYNRASEGRTGLGSNTSTGITGGTGTSTQTR